MKYERMLMDIEAQHDFFAPGGSHYTREASRAARNIYKLFAWARQESIPVLSTVLRVRRDERGPLAPRPHCVEGADGEQKLLRTVLPKRINMGLRNTTDLPLDLFDSYNQVIFEKRHTDIFRHAAAERLLTELEGTTFILCGAGIAHGIVEAEVGMRVRGFGVILASDAVISLNDPLETMAVKRMDAKGVIFAPTSKIVTAANVARLATRSSEKIHLPFARRAG